MGPASSGLQPVFFVSAVSRFLELLSAQVLQSAGEAPCGLQYHILDVYMSEMATVAAHEVRLSGTRVLAAAGVFVFQDGDVLVPPAHRRPEPGPHPALLQNRRQDQRVRCHRGARL